MDKKWFYKEHTDHNLYSKRKKWPKLSIVTPSYNQGQYLEETILSIINQNYPNLEYIIIDGGSTDNSLEIIKKYEKYLTYWVSEADKGQTDAINKGFEKCTGDIFNWLNSDDFLEKDALYYIADKFVEENAVAVLANYYWYYESENRSEEYQTKIIDNSYIKTAVYSKNHQPGTFFLKSKLDNLFPLNIKLHYVMDQELWIGFLLKTMNVSNLVYLNEPVANLRQHKETKTFRFINEFEREYNSLFYGLAGLLSEPVKAKLIKRIVLVDRKKLTLFNISKYNRESVEQAVDYFLFKLLHISFLNIRKYNLSKGIVQLINIRSLTKEDQEIINKLRKRQAYFFWYVWYCIVKNNFDTLFRNNTKK